MNLSLTVQYNYDFEMYGINSSLKEHVLAWNIEKKLDFEFNQKEEFSLEFLKGRILFSRYSYEEDFGYLRIIKNKSWKNENNPPYLIPEMKQFDYLLFLDGEIKDLKTIEILSNIKNISNVLYLQKIEINNLKSKENLIFD